MRAINFGGKLVCTAACLFGSAKRWRRARRWLGGFGKAWRLSLNDCLPVRAFVLPLSLRTPSLSVAGDNLSCPVVGLAGLGIDDAASESNRNPRDINWHLSSAKDNERRTEARVRVEKIAASTCRVRTCAALDSDALGKKSGRTRRREAAGPRTGRGSDAMPPSTIAACGVESAFWDAGCRNADSKAGACSAQEGKPGSRQAKAVRRGEAQACGRKERGKRQVRTEKDGWKAIR
ncbi:hypothetical protein B0H10DRAFT_1939364 [Mycena sp. CBHHK59/15]|nr:hypothetical protein B0H10DRAFT_1939364 [Mycena sp. CBHHK59/15]